MLIKQFVIILGDSKSIENLTAFVVFAKWIVMRQSMWVVYEISTFWEKEIPVDKEIQIHSYTDILFNKKMPWNFSDWVKLFKHSNYLTSPRWRTSSSVCGLWWCEIDSFDLVNKPKISKIPKLQTQDFISKCWQDLKFITHILQNLKFNWLI